MYIKNCSVTKLYYWAVIYPAVSSDFDAIWDFKMNYLMKLSNFTCCMCTSELISPHFIQLVLLGWKEVTAVLFLICALVKFASFATVKDSWKLLMLSCPSVRVWFIHLKLPELRWVKPWRCLLITVIMMQLKKRKQKERKGLSLREIRVQLNKSGPTKSVSLSLTLWTLWAVFSCFKVRAVSKRKYSEAKLLHKSLGWSSQGEKMQGSCFNSVYFNICSTVVAVHINLAWSPLTQILLQELYLHLKWQLLSLIVLSRWGNLLL